MRKIKRFAALAAAAILAVSMLAACGGGNEAAAPAEAAPAASAEAAAPAEKPSGVSDKTLTVALQGEPGLLIPDIQFAGNHVYSVMRMMYEPLITYKTGTTELAENSIVKSIEWTDDLHANIELNDKVRFQNGDPVTTADIQYMFELGVVGPVTSYWSVYDPTQFEIQDDTHMTLVLGSPWGQAEQMMSFQMYMVPNKSILEAAGGLDVTDQYLDGCGTGKYKMKEWIPGQSITLERDDNYWDQDNLGYYKEVKFVFVADASAREMTIKSGDANVAYEAQLSDYPIYQNDPDVKCILTDTGKAGVIWLNSGKEGSPFKDEKVREAMGYLIDVAAMKNVVFSGFGSYCDTIISPVNEMYDGKTPAEPSPVDVEKAKALLAEAGYADGFTVQIPCMNAVSPQITMIQENLAKANITVETQVLELGAYFGLLGSGDYDMMSSAMENAYYSEGVKNTDGADFSYLECFGGCGYNDPEYSAIVMKALQTRDMTERKAAYADLQEYYRAHHISIGTYTSTTLTLTSPDVEGIVEFGTNVLDMSNVYSTAN